MECADHKSLYHRLPLDSAIQEIRLLDLQASSDVHEIEAEIKVVSLRTSPDYQALSYTWGGTHSNRTIRLNASVDLPITDNLYDALKSLRFQDSKRTLWVDAVCIDQSKIQERSDQVAFMHDIYSSAASVLIWLGEPAIEDVPPTTDEEIEAVMSEIDEKCAGLRKHYPTQTSLKEDIEHLRTLKSAIVRSQPPWHTRAWIIQEFLCAKKRIFKAGLLELEDEDWYLSATLKCAIGILVSDTVSGVPGAAAFLHLEDLFVKLKALDNLMLGSSACIDGHEKPDEELLLANYHARSRDGIAMWRKPDLYSFRVELRRSLQSVAIDPRDQVYSLLGLIRKDEAQLIGSDYTLTCAQVYAKATYATLVCRKDFDILRHKVLCVEKQDDVASVSCLPSWAVDFSTQVASTEFRGISESMPPGFSDSDRNCQRQQHLAIGEDNLSLHITGQIIGRIIGPFAADSDLNSFNGSGPDLALSMVQFMCSLFFHLERLDTTAAMHPHCHRDLSIRMAALLRVRDTSDRKQKLNACLQDLDSQPASAPSMLVFPFYDDITNLPPPSVPVNGGVGFMEGWPDDDVDWNLQLGLSYNYEQYSSEVSGGQLCFMTLSGFVGLAPGVIKDGDVVVLVPTSRYPLILRQRDDCWTFQGLAYVHRLMDTEVLEKLLESLPTPREFIIQ